MCGLKVGHAEERQVGDAVVRWVGGQLGEATVWLVKWKTVENELLQGSRFRSFSTVIGLRL